jgi:adenylyltransferase/sulfurtransferase
MLIWPRRPGVAMLTDYDRSRYARQILIPGWGDEGQERIKNATVFIAGAGGLGGPVAIYLATAGVGTIRICDADVVELSNLNRQILHTDEGVGRAKAVSAERRLREVNPSLRIEGLEEFIDEASVERLVGKADVVLDCLDNYPTRFLLNAHCARKRIPLVHGAIWGMTGQVTVVQPPETPCLRCVIPEAPPKEVFPVLGVTPGVTGCLQGFETLKLITGIGVPLKGRMLTFDAEYMRFSTLNLRRVKGCADCGHL